MKPKLLLRIAAGVVLLHAIGHTTGVFTWQTGGEVPLSVVKAMQETPFSFMGREGSTMAGFYDGFGYCGTIFLLFVTALLWIVSNRRERSTLKILWITGFSLVLLAINEMIYFFPMAVAFSLISAILVFVSIYLHKTTNRR